MKRCRFELVCHPAAASNGARVAPPPPPSFRPLLKCVIIQSHNLRRRSLAVGRHRLVIRWNFAAAAGEESGRERSFVCGRLRKRRRAKAVAAASVVACRFWLMETQQLNVYLVICVHTEWRWWGSWALKQLLN